MTPELEPAEDPRVLRARERLGMVLGGKWTLDALIGVGGMAVVYGATHRNGKRVAVKVLHAELSHHEEIRKRFLQEGYAANAIQHEGAVSVLDDDVAPDGSAFLVMELLEGETVDARWERSGRRLSVPEVLDLADQLLDVLAAAHAKNVVHRDIKPENLFFTRSGALKVLDFGIARVFEREAGRGGTRAGTIMGTPAFMAPEQAMARWKEVDGRTDLWAVGATMFTLLSGRQVHEAESDQEQLILSATRRAPALASVEPGISASVAAIVDRALAFEREHRWPDAGSMQAAVRAALEAVGRPPSGDRDSARRRAAGASSGQGPASRITAATAIDTTGTMGSPLSAWTNERDLRAGETTKIRATLSGLQQRRAEARTRVAEAEEKVDAGRAERKSLEQWFSRQVGTRTAAVEQARAEVRSKMLAIARRARDDRAVLGADFDPAREQIAKLELAAVSAARDVTVHEAALHVYDAAAVRRGLLLSAVLFLVLVVGPIVWRATRVVEPPVPGAAAPSRAAPAR
ncbi:MAG: serine/threonine protein kinase [Myxococcales bacterium]|nr:serine/threonine protein kinase [Myxococcales bacterium]